MLARILEDRHSRQ